MRKAPLHGWDGSRGYDPIGIPVSRINHEYTQRDGKPPIQGSLTLGGLKKEKEWFGACRSHFMKWEPHNPNA